MINRIKYATIISDEVKRVIGGCDTPLLGNIRFLVRKSRNYD